MDKTYKIAVISDIHSNFVALKAIIDELENMNIDDIVIAGDNIGGFLQPNQTIELIQKSNARVIHGNREDYLRYYSDGTHSVWDNYHQMLPIVWTKNKLTKNNTDFIFNLPTQITFNINHTSFRVVHGSPNNVSELIYKNETSKIEKLLACVDEDILICGHCHQQWHKLVKGTLIVNPGSVGLSFRKGGIAPYSLLIYKDNNWIVEEKSVKYSIDEVIKAFKKVDIKNYNAWEKMLVHSITDGKVATLAFLKFAKDFAISRSWDDKRGLIPNNHWLEAENAFDWQNYEYKRK